MAKRCHLDSVVFASSDQSGSFLFPFIGRPMNDAWNRWPFDRWLEADVDPQFDDVGGNEEWQTRFFGFSKTQ